MLQLLDFILYFVQFFFLVQFSGYYFQLSIYSVRCSVFIPSQKNSFKNIRTDVKIFPSPIAYWSGLVIFKEKQENPDETGMVGQSALIIGHHSGHESFSL